MSIKLFKSTSALTVILLSAIIIYIRFSMPFNSIIEWDVFGYYLYLPAKFIYHDLKLHNMAWVNQIYTQYKPSATLYQINGLPDGIGHSMRYPIGPAVLSLPFFFLAHLYVKISGAYPADGFSIPYQFAYCMAALFYTLVGLIYTRKFLLKFFSEKITSLLLVLIVLATNYLQLVTEKSTLPHNYVFSLYAILLYYTYKWHESPHSKYAFVIGLMAGLITITRPNECIVLLIPFLWGVYSKETFRAKMQLLWQRKADVLWMGAAGILGLLPLLVYWKHATGHWLYMSYNDPAVGFEFLHPYTWQFLFSFRKGWFIYTPVMFFACLGFINLYKRNKPIFWPLLIYSLLNLYIVSSWSCWWYAGGSFSARTQMSSYALMAIPLGYLIVDVLKIKMGLALVVILSVFTISLNLFQHLQERNGVLDGDRMTMAYYFLTFGKLNATGDDRKLLLVERSFSMKDDLSGMNNLIKSNIGIFDFENPSKDDLKHYSDKIKHSGPYSFILDSNTQYSPGLDEKYEDLTNKDYAWIHASVWMYMPKGTEKLPDLVVSFHHHNYPYKFRTQAPAIGPDDYDKWVQVSMNYMTPEVRSATDNLKVFVWYQGKKPVYIDDMVIDKYEPK